MSSQKRQNSLRCPVRPLIPGNFDAAASGTGFYLAGAVPIGVSPVFHLLAFLPVPVNIDTAGAASHRSLHAFRPFQLQPDTAASGRPVSQLPGSQGPQLNTSASGRKMILRHSGIHLDIAASGAAF